MGSVAYAITEGDYDDYRVVAVYLDKEAAERNAKALGEEHGVEEFPLGPETVSYVSHSVDFNERPWSDAESARSEVVNAFHIPEAEGGQWSNFMCNWIHAWSRISAEDAMARAINERDSTEALRIERKKEWG